MKTPQPERDLLQERANNLAGEIMRTEYRIIEGLKASASKRAAGVALKPSPAEEVVRESEHCIWLKATQWSRERKTNKVSEWEHYYRTAQEALDALRNRATKRLAAVEAEAVELRQVLADMSPNAEICQRRGEARES